MDSMIFAGLPENIKFDFLRGIKIGSPQGIIDSVSAVLNVEKRYIIGESRKREFVEARQIAMGLILESNPAIGLKNLGRIFNRDHSTVIYAKRTYDNLYETDKSFKAKVKKVRNMTHYD